MPPIKPTVKRHARIAKAILGDLAKLRRPVTAAATAATLAAVVSPYGLDVGDQGAYLVGGLFGVGLVAAYLEHLRKA